jgi:DNA helicase HerA-like ATPase
MDLFPRDKRDGVFRGFQQGGLEFHADLVLPYRNDLQNVPMHGQFLLVQLEHEDEAVLGRIASFSSEGKLAFGSGEEFNIRAMLEDRAVPDDLREQYLRYRVNIRVLGCVRVTNEKLTFVPSHRRLPHVGARVAFPTEELLRALAGHDIEGAEIGHLALGEYVYYGDAPGLDVQPFMQLCRPEVKVRFTVSNLVARRSFVFARAGFGKSNLNKLLFSELYREPPTVKKRHRQAPVGTLIFDPDGEYFWPDDKGRPGLADVEHLRDRLVVFTSREAPSRYYGSFKVSGIKLDIRSLRPADVIGIALDAERQSQQNVLKLKGMNPLNWDTLVNLIAHEGNGADENAICELLHLDPERQAAEAVAARSNMTVIVNMLHDPSSRMLDLLMRALEDGKICVIDISQLRGRQGLILSGLILRRIFDRNQQEFTSADARTIPVIAVVEEAQSVLDERSPASEPYVAWVKEGRKYDLGALLITQQPGSIPIELLSQGDNWFLFHLLSSADLVAAKKANAHFSDDLLSSLLNEPIPGQGLLWSSVSGTPYPVPFRVASFERKYKPLDPQYNKDSVPTYASQLREKSKQVIRRAQDASESASDLFAQAHPGSSMDEQDSEPAAIASEGVDVRVLLRNQAIAALRDDRSTMEKLTTTGVAWGTLNAFFENHLPQDSDNLKDAAYHMSRHALKTLFGPGGFETFRNERTGKNWVRKKP